MKTSKLSPGGAMLFPRAGQSESAKAPGVSGIFWVASLCIICKKRKFMTFHGLGLLEKIAYISV